MRRFCHTLLYLVLLTPFLYARAGALEIGEKLNLAPSFTLQEIYDSNVFKQKDKASNKSLFNDTQMDEFISVYALGLDLEYSLANHKLSMMGEKKFVDFAHYNGQDYETELLGADAALHFGGGFYLTPFFRYENRVVPRQSNWSRKKNDFLERNALRMEAGYDASQWGLSASAEQKDFSYDIRTRLDREALIYTGTVFFSPSDLQRWHIKYRCLELEFDTTSRANNNVVHDVLLGASLVLGGSDLLTVELGKRWKRFDYNPGRDFQGLVVETGLIHRISDETSLSIDFSRRVETAYFNNTTYYVQESLGGDFSWQITPKIGSTVYTSYAWTDYRGVAVGGTRWLKYLKAGAGLFYSPHENVSLSLSYEYQERDSDMRNRRFDAHQAVASVQVQWK